MPEINSGDTAWLLASAALVLFMTPGLAAFYGGMVRRKNVLDTTLQSFFALGLIGVLWAVIGYSLAFTTIEGPLAPFIGGLSFAGLNGIGGTVHELAGTIPQSVFAMFQGMFAIITVGLITGAVAERMKFKAYVVFALLWSLFVYSPLAHWVWQPSGWLFKLGALDFAGGTVVHISSAAAALAAAIMLGRRKGYGKDKFHPHNVTMTVLGAGILWFGWFGFNAGSALTAGDLAGTAFLNTNIAAAAAVLTWTGIEWFRAGKPTALGAASGAVAGLVAITPACGYVEPWAALLIGGIAGVACFYGLSIKGKLKIDDALDVLGIHGVGGTLGALLTGVFASSSVNSAIAGGALYGNMNQLWIQIVGVVAAWVFSFAVSMGILAILKATMGLRVDEDAEIRGLDLAEHNEEGYILD